MARVSKAQGSAIACFLIGIFLCCTALQAQDRFALVVGNQSSSLDRAENVSANDVEVVSKALALADFNVTTLFDQTADSFANALRDWSRELDGNSVALFYFSGDAVSLNGVNYLLQPQAKSEPFRVDTTRAISLNNVVNRLRNLTSTLFVVLEAAKPNSTDLVNAPVNLNESYENTVIMYASVPGSFPVEWPRPVSLFSGIVANQLSRPGQNLSGLFSQITSGVVNGSDGKQVPWLQSSLAERFLFRNGLSTESTALTATDRLLTRLRLDMQPEHSRICFHDLEWQCGADSELVVGKTYQVFASMSGYRDYFGSVQISAEHQPLTVQLVKASQQTVIETKFGLFREIQGGIFLAGSPANERGRQSSEAQRQHLVPSFFMLENEVTFEDYQSFTKATAELLPDDNNWGRKQRPVINISSEQATRYVDWLAAETDFDVRLPTAVQWEYAARAGSTDVYHYGASLSSEQANFQSRNGTVPVRSYTPNEWGLSDIHGNVWEYVCSNDYQRNSGCDKSLLKGGGWNSIAAAVRSAYVTVPSMAISGGTIGLRPIVIIPE